MLYNSRSFLTHHRNPQLQFKGVFLSGGMIVLIQIDSVKLP